MQAMRMERTEIWMRMMMMTMMKHASDPAWQKSFARFDLTLYPGGGSLALACPHSRHHNGQHTSLIELSAVHHKIIS